MKRKNSSFKNNYAVSELVGGIILVLVALLIFTSIYLYIFPLPIQVDTPKPDLYGYVTQNGQIAITHQGGNPIQKYKIDIRNLNNTLISSKTYNPQKPWRIGETIHPSDNIYLLSEEDQVKVQIYQQKEEKYVQIFNGILSGKQIPSGTPILISTLRTNTTDEDLICFTNTLQPEINNPIYVYNWKKNDETIYNLLLPFNIKQPNIAYEYSNQNHGNIHGATWTSNGIKGGSYNFDGIDDYISIPYCFQKKYISNITVNTWIKTYTLDGTILSFNPNQYFELQVKDGNIKWITHTNVTKSIKGNTIVNDGKWHQITATYNSSTGDTAIYVDGEKDQQKNTHQKGEKLGETPIQNATIGKSTVQQLFEENWETLTYDTFEEGWGNYTDGDGHESDCQITNNYAHQGSRSARLRDNEGTDSSFYHQQEIDVDTPEYNTIKIEFWWMWNDYWGGWEDGENWLVEYWNGNQWKTILNRIYPSGYQEDRWYHETLYINESNYNFPTDMKIRFRCDASWNNDRVFFDQIYVNASSIGTETVNFTGKIDEIKIYKKTLSEEQIYQNYLNLQQTPQTKEIIVSEETKIGGNWRCILTPVNTTKKGTLVESNIIQIKNYNGGET